MNSHLEKALHTRDSEYLRYHAPRYDRLLTLLHRYATQESAVLDIGCTAFTGIAHTSLGLPLDTLGLEPDRETATGRHFHFNLNETAHPERCRTDLPRYDIIVFCEVLEHLHTSPIQVLTWLKTLLKPGAIMIVQTPNAVVLHKRIQMMLGRNPFELISENLSNPKHYREYTARELEAYFRQTDFSVLEKSAEAYFDYRHTSHEAGRSKSIAFLGMLNFAYRLMPPSLRPGLCYVIDPA